MRDARHRSGTSSWLRPRALAVGLVAGAALAAAIWLPGRHDVASAATQTTVFDDEFGSAHGTPASTAKWSVDGQDDSAAVADGSGHLLLTQFMSSKSLFSQPYGHAVARVEVERVSGPWRAFTVLGPSGRILPGRMRVLDPDADPTSGDAFHTYTIDWSPSTIVWSVDGKPSVELTPDDPAPIMGIAFDLAADGIGPAQETIDYVRVSAGTDATPATVAPSPSASKAAATVAWKAFTQYTVGELVTYDGATYRVKAAHTSLPGWYPSSLPALFEKI